MKALVRDVVRPVWVRVWHRIASRLEPRLVGMEQRLAAIEQRLDNLAGWATQQKVQQAGTEQQLLVVAARLAELDVRHERWLGLQQSWQAHLPGFLDAVTGVRAFGYELASVKQQAFEQDAQLRAAVERADARAGEGLERVEFVRREILFELLHGTGHAHGSRQAASESRVLSPEKVDAARGALRLNLGCGHVPLDGYLNVDQRELPGVDIVAEAGVLPFEPASVQEIHSAHMLEHFPQEALRRRLLPYWRRLLRPDGVFSAVVPDGEAMLAHSADGSYAFEEFREVLFGAQDYEGDFHYNLMTPQSLTALLEEAGFADVRVPVRGRRNGKCFEFEIAARRP